MEVKFSINEIKLSHHMGNKKLKKFRAIWESIDDIKLFSEDMKYNYIYVGQ